MTLYSTESRLREVWPAVLAGFVVVLIGAILGWYGEGSSAFLLFILTAMMVAGTAITLLGVALVRRWLGLSFRWSMSAYKQCGVVAIFLVIGVVVSWVGNASSVALSKRRAESITLRLERFRAVRLRYPETLAQLERADGVTIPRPTISREPFGYTRFDSYYVLSFHGTFIAFYKYRSDTSRWYDEDDNED